MGYFYPVFGLFLIWYLALWGFSKEPLLTAFVGVTLVGGWVLNRNKRINLRKARNTYD